MLNDVLLSDLYVQWLTFIATPLLEHSASMGRATGSCAPQPEYPGVAPCFFMSPFDVNRSILSVATIQRPTTLHYGVAVMGQQQQPQQELNEEKPSQACAHGRVQ